MEPLVAPVLQTQRLLLRPFVPGDAAAVARLAGDREVAAPTLNIPHPYHEADARDWFETHPRDLAEGTGIVLAVTLRPGTTLVGAAGLSSVDRDHSRAEIGYWVGRPFWNRGYCTEACRALLDHAFGELGLFRVYASHFATNPASGRVMQKLGMHREGLLHGHVLRWGTRHDLVCYGILNSGRPAATQKP